MKNRESCSCIIGAEARQRTWPKPSSPRWTRRRNNRGEPKHLSVTFSGIVPEMKRKVIMKMKIMSAVAGASLLLGFGVLLAFAQPKGDTVKVKGEVVDLWCFLEGGDRGADHKQCAISCAKAGNPIGLVTEKDEVYVITVSKAINRAKTCSSTRWLK